MEEKNAQSPEQVLKDLQSVSGGVSDKIRTLFARWSEEGVEPADMFRRITALFDSDPRQAEEAFGGDYLDIVDYFTHYWG